MLPPTYVGLWDMKDLPSPEQLRYKVLIKVRELTALHASVMCAYVFLRLTGGWLSV